MSTIQCVFIVWVVIYKTAYHMLGKSLKVVHVGGTKVVVVLIQAFVACSVAPLLEAEPPVEELSVLEASQENLVLA